MVCSHVMCLGSDQKRRKEEKKPRRATCSGHSLGDITSSHGASLRGRTRFRKNRFADILPVILPPPLFFSLLLSLFCVYTLTVSSGGGTDSAASPVLIMAHSMTFSALNEKLRPRINTSYRVYSTLDRLDKQTGSLKSFPVSYRPTILPEIKVSDATIEPEVNKEPEEDVEQQVEDLVSNGQEEEGSESLLFNTSCLTEVTLNEDGAEEQLVDEDSSLSLAEEKDIPGELTSEVAGVSSQSTTSEDGSSFQRSYVDGTLPDLIRSGRPLGRRRTLGHVSETVGKHSLLV